MRPRSGVGAGDHAAHAVADDVRGRIGLDEVQQMVQVGIVVRIPVAVPLPLAQPESPPVGRNHVPVALEAIHQELERRRNIHPAVEKNEFWMARLAPRAHVVAQPADVVIVRCARFRHE